VDSAVLPEGRAPDTPLAWPDGIPEALGAYYEVQFSARLEDVILRSLLGLGTAAALVSLLLPWIVGNDSGRYTVAGWEARPLFTVVIVLLCFGQLMLATHRRLLRRVPWAPLVLALASLGMTRWVVSHNDYYEVPSLDYGIWVSVAAQGVVLVIAAALLRFREP
jgi:hypothetical protein